jgi:hypothetical protein
MEQEIRECGCPVEKNFNRTNMILWIKGLQSGRYPQGRLRLATKEREDWHYCCLGVSCEVAIANGLVIDVAVEARGFSGTRLKSYNGSRSALPEAVTRWLGVPESDITIPLMSLMDGQWVCIGTSDVASHANDDLMYSFDGIAAALMHRFEITQEEIDAA